MSGTQDTQTQPTCFAEGLEDILQRNRPAISDLWLEVLGDIRSGSIIVIKGSSGSGKSMFLMQIMAKAIMREMEMEVLLIDAEKSFKIFHFVDLCSDLMEANFNYNTIAHQNQIRKKLEKLHIAFPSEEIFDLFIVDLDKKLSNEPLISLVMIDSIGLFFYSDCKTLKDNRHEVLMNSYLEKFKQLTRKYRITIVFTVPDYVEESIEYRDNITTVIKLAKFITTGNFLMKLKSQEEEKELLFAIDSRGIKLLNSSQEALQQEILHDRV